MGGKRKVPILDSNIKRKVPRLDSHNEGKVPRLDSNEGKEESAQTGF